MGSLCVLMFLNLLFLFVKPNSAQCAGVPLTFGETEISTCKNYVNCDNQVISGCLDNLQNAVHIKVKSKVQKFRQGAITNMKNLKSIDLRSINLELFEPGALSNLPSIESISAHGNSLTNIPNEVFSKLNFRSVDLTSNKIANIDDFAFAFMPRLYGIYLGNNLINQIRSNWFLNSTNIGELILANNRIAVIASDAFSKIKRLDYLDLSFNNIHQIDEFKFGKKQFDILNLAGNQLTDVTFLNGYRILQFYLSLNNISYVESSASKSMAVRYIFVHPNPWQCTCLKTFWNETVALEEQTENDFNVKNWSTNYPLCIEKLQDRDVCTMVKDQEFVSCQEEYFKFMNYSKLENRDNTPIFLRKLYDRYDNVIAL